jgi:hypothetical protein
MLLTSLGLAYNNTDLLRKCWQAEAKGLRRAVMPFKAMGPAYKRVPESRRASMRPLESWLTQHALGTRCRVALWGVMPIHSLQDGKAGSQRLDLS